METSGPIDQPVPELPVADVEAARSYYCEKLGFERRWVHGDLASVSLGRAVIFFRLTAATISPQHHWIFANNVDVTYEEMKSNGADIIDPLADKPWGLRQFTIRDVDGHQFYIFHDLPIGGTE